ncbi:DEAD/DEAH box helicase [Paenarthrobacter sp. DKR-5]|uniref:DEAD/DEAH box helicase n=1 Tax=Paenarthrobacter sp. DKR-5 TaxID=2835535 RepID=UPI001BDDB845|nr:DEAD/DEAH box helicase [Paenarthrobacter sp. DKR-5]MBT1004058.1 DEAD/DEAH box helicase [Paenarthrobacter sp. DKR-5]
MSGPAYPLVDVNDLIRMVGATAYHRGRAYTREGAVASLDWDETTGFLDARVSGTAPTPYHVRVQLVHRGEGYRMAGDTCTCPVGYGCKHVAAAVTASNLEHVRQRQGLLSAATAPSGTDWQRTLDGLIGSPATAPEPSGRSVTPLGLQFDLRDLGTARSGRWGASPLKRAAKRHHYQLGVRPVVPGAKGNWVRNNLSWGSIGYQTYGLKLDPEQHRWFSQFPSLHRGTGITYFGQNDSWLYLDDFANPLLWQLLADAQRLGIAFVGAKKSLSVVVGERAVLGMDARQDDAGLELTPVLTIDGAQHPLESAGLTGNHGVYTYRPQPDPVVTLAPTVRPLTEQDEQLIEQPRPVTVPAEDAGTFLERYYPVLQQRLAVTSSDGSVSFPELAPPLLVLTAKFKAGHTLTLDWSWEYRHGAAVDTKPLFAAAGDTGYRDTAAETAVLASVSRALRGADVRQRTLEDLDAAEFAEHSIPLLEKLDGVRVDIKGKRPDYRELTDEPQLVISTVESDRRDWFDLGVMVKVGGKSIPFDHIFKALAKGKSKVLLTDGRYFSINRPEFQQLNRLIEDSRELQEWETGPRISRYQAGLWEELEELAGETVQAQAWRQSVKGLLDFASSDRVHLGAAALPRGLKAELRPYQLEGYQWLAFLWEHSLGGVLADDMGLGKTLQTLALLSHAREVEREAAPRPFLVVAPTSVVPNWASEAQRFTPDLKVVTVSDSSTKGKVPLADAVAGADVVVTSYTLFRLDFDRYRALGWDGLILDEAQFVKNKGTRVHQCARDLDAPFKLAITGTPMENNLMELWSLFAIVAPGLFPSARLFAEDYQRPIERNGDERKLATLRRRIRPLMMRRTKEAVAKELPAKQEQVLEVELGPKHRKIYQTHLQRERQKIMGLLEDLDRQRFIVFRSLTLLRLMSLDASLVDEAYDGVPSAKLDALFEQLEDVLAEGHRALVFSQFTSFLKKAAARLDAEGVEYTYLDGSTRRRAEVIEKFKSGHAGVFLISLKAGGFGLNLTEADYCFLLDPWWNPATEAQAVDRTHRIGQTRNVMVYRMVAKGTIEEKVMALKEQKAKLFSSVMDDDAAFSSALTAEDIRGLLEV